MATATDGYVLTDLHRVTHVLLSDGVWHTLTEVEIGDYQYLNGDQSAFRVRANKQQPGISWVENGQRISCPMSSVLAVRQDRE